jgi:PilZ domain
LAAGESVSASTFFPAFPLNCELRVAAPNSASSRTWVECWSRMSGVTKPCCEALTGSAGIFDSGAGKGPVAAQSVSRGASSANAKTKTSTGCLKFPRPLPMKLISMPGRAEMVWKYRDPIAPDRRKEERILTCLPIRIVSVGDSPTSYPGLCRNLSHRGVGFETDAPLQVGQVVELEFVQLVDEVVFYSIQILSRNGRRYGGQYVDSDDDDT